MLCRCYAVIRGLDVVDNLRLPYIIMYIRSASGSLQLVGCSRTSHTNRGHHTASGKSALLSLIVLWTCCR